MSQTIPPALTDPVLSSSTLVWPCSHCLLSLSVSPPSVCVILAAGEASPASSPVLQAALCSSEHLTCWLV